MLYIVPTPIGNLQDMSLRAVDILKEVDLIYAEDTRTSGRLLSHFNIETPVRSYHSFNEHKIIEHIFSELELGKSIAQISDAGTPGISDPGFLLSRLCRENNIPIQVLPGSTACIPALVMSGLPCDKFFFEGFLPHKKGRQTRIKFLASLPCTFIMYESPHRIIKCLDQLIEFCGETRSASLSREISKLHEELIRGTLTEIKDTLEKKQAIKGEIVLVVAGLS